MRYFFPLWREAELEERAFDFLSNPAVRVLLSTARMHRTVTEWLRAGLVKATSALYSPGTTRLFSLGCYASVFDVMFTHIAAKSG